MIISAIRSANKLPRATMPRFKPVLGGAWVLEDEKIFLSFIMCADEKDPLIKTAQKLLDEHLSRRGIPLWHGPETALVVKNSNFLEQEYYVLKGDFRQQYENVFPNLDQCLKIFNENIFDISPNDINFRKVFP